MRSREREEQAAIVDDVEGGVHLPRVIKPKYFDIRWTHTELLPAHLLVGFQVVLFTGTDPNNTDAYLVDPVRVGPSERRVVVTLRVLAALTVKSAVQALYSNG